MTSVAAALEVMAGAWRPQVTAATAYGHAADRIRAISVGFHMHVTRPFMPAELIAVVSSLARRNAAG